MIRKSGNDRHVRKATRAYAARHDLILRTLQTDFADWLDPVPSAAGLHLCTRLRPGASVDLDRVLDRAREAGVAVESLATYYAGDRPQPGLVLGYGGIRTDAIPAGLRLLAHLERVERP